MATPTVFYQPGSYGTYSSQSASDTSSIASLISSRTTDESRIVSTGFAVNILQNAQVSTSASITALTTGAAAQLTSITSIQSAAAASLAVAAASTSSISIINARLAAEENDVASMIVASGEPYISAGMATLLGADGVPIGVTTAVTTALSSLFASRTQDETTLASMSRSTLTDVVQRGTVLNVGTLTSAPIVTSAVIIASQSVPTTVAGDLTVTGNLTVTDATIGYYDSWTGWWNGAFGGNVTGVTQPYGTLAGGFMVSRIGSVVTLMLNQASSHATEASEPAVFSVPVNSWAFPNSSAGVACSAILSSNHVLYPGVIKVSAAGIISMQLLNKDWDVSWPCGLTQDTCITYLVA